MDNNPLKQIFKLDSNGELIPHLETISNISKFFEYLESNPNEDDPSPSFEEKSEVILDFCNLIKENRTFIEFFSSYNEKSIYFYLFDIYLNIKSSESLKSLIIIFLNELRINIQINKEIFTYLFNNLSLIYRGEQDETNFYNNLTLLNIILGETENYLKPRNYFACNGYGKLIYDYDNNEQIEIGYYLTFILNFKINLNLDDIDPNNNSICNLIKMKFDNNSSIIIELKSNGSLQIKDKTVKLLPKNEWINLIINIVVTKEDKIKLYFFVNGESEIKEENIDGIKLKNTDKRNILEFLENVPK